MPSWKRIRLWEEYHSGAASVKTIPSRPIALEDVFKSFSLERKGGDIAGRRLNHICFADDIVLISSDPDELEILLRELEEFSQTVGLKMNLQKTKIMSLSNKVVTIGNHTLEKVDEHVYLGHNIKLGKDNQTAEITRRIGLTWAAIVRLSHILASLLTSRERFMTHASCPSLRMSPKL